ncbi:MAG: glycosyltransferase [Clostridia bacterium]|nr:glycosyltransferase [Clostridia bacterium]
MLVLVIPAKNESNRLICLLNHLLAKHGFTNIFVILNGSTDNTADEICHLADHIKIVHYREALGYDVPRAMGAYHAYRAGATGVIFVDGDMVGEFIDNLLDIKGELQGGADLVLTNCYPYVAKRHPLASKAIHFRLLLNKELGLYHKIGIASPSHGLVGVSRRFLETIPLQELAIPPVSLALARKKNLVIKVGTAISHLDLGSKIRTPFHAKKIADTIIGDCLEAICAFKGVPRNRTCQGKEYQGYHPLRRFDLISSLTVSPPVN